MGTKVSHPPLSAGKRGRKCRNLKRKEIRKGRRHNSDPPAERKTVSSVLGIPQGSDLKTHEECLNWSALICRKESLPLAEAVNWTADHIDHWKCDSKVLTDPKMDDVQLEGDR